MRVFVLCLVSLLLLAHPVSARAELGLYAGTHLGAGQAGHELNDTYTKRSVGVLDFQAMPGFHFYGKAVLAGLMLDARLLSQLSTSVNTATAGDLGGKGLLLGPGVNFDFTFGRLLLVWDMRARQSVNEPDATFKGSGFNILAGYRAMPGFTVDLEYVVAKYNALSIGDVETGLGSAPISQKSFGLGVSLSL